MKKIKLFLIMIFITLFLTTGCWQYRELNDLAIVAALGIDKEEDGYLLSVQIINVRKQTTGFSGNEETPVTVFEAKGRTLSEALNKISLKIPYELYFEHIDVVVIGEETAKLGIREFIDFLLRDRDVRKIYPVVIAKEAKAIDVLKILTPIETLPTVNLTDTISTAQIISGYTAKRSFENVLECLYMRGRHPGVSAVEIIGKVEDGEKSDNIDETVPKTRLIADKVGLLKDDKLVGFISDKAALGYNLIRRRVVNSVISFPCNNDDYGSVKMDKPKVDYKIKLDKDNKPSAEIKIEFTATLVEYNCKLDIKESKSIKKIEKMVDEEMKTIIEAVLYETQKNYKTDVLGFGQYIYQNDYKKWLKVEKEWDEMFSKMPYKIEVKSKINNTGSITTPAREGGSNSEK